MPPNIHIVPGGGNRVVFGNGGKFPRVGAWTMVQDRLGVIFQITDGVAHIHPVDPKTGDSITVIGPDQRPATETILADAATLAPATLDQMLANPRNGHITPFAASVLGYPISDAHLNSMTALERKRVNKSLNDADAAQGLIEESEEHLINLKRAKVAVHPEAVALEAQTETERQAFVASVEARRQAMFDKLSK